LSQLGRFHQIDPIAGFSYEFSPYAFANNNPLSLRDPSGLKADTAVDGVPLMAEVVVVGYKKKNPAAPASDVKPEDDSEPKSNSAPVPATPTPKPLKRCQSSKTV
jgi:hypothetical protein